MGERSGLAGGDVPEQVADHALRQVVALDEVGQHELLQLRHQPPVTADHAGDQSLVAEVIESALTAVPLPCRIDEREVARSALRLLARRLLREEVFLDCHGDAFGKTDADEPAGRDGIAIPNQTHRFFRRDDLVAPLRQLARQDRMHLLHIAHSLTPTVVCSFNRGPRAHRTARDARPSRPWCRTTIPVPRASGRPRR